ncbi:MAG: class I SAM-dependent methyltransferase [Chloroflexi bacterium]|nr:class I SAM-dependent methyltransferase [Chloroflexota bacterium]
MSDFKTHSDVLITENWRDYELLDSGDGLKFERFGPYTFVRPEPQAMWRPKLAEKEWHGAHAVFQGGDDEESGGWSFNKPLPARWEMHWGDIRFFAEATPFRHLGVFPEHAAQWKWMTAQVQAATRPINVLNLFAYTGISTLTLAAAGAQVTHVDASKKVVAWARENQTLSSLNERPVRWIIDDALKFTQRAARRGTRYDALIIDPPKFGRGPKGELWKLHESLPLLLQACGEVLSDQPLFAILTAYAVKVSPLSLYHLLEDLFSGHSGQIRAGEMALREKSGGRLLATSAYGRWEQSK